MNMIPPIVLLFLFNSIFNTEFELFDGVEQNFTYIEYIYQFSFKIKASVNQAVYISLKVQLENTDNVKDPFLFPSISEYSRGARIPSYTINNIKFANKNRNSYFECFILYKISFSSTYYVSLQLEPLFSLSYIVTNVDIIDGVYDLNNGIVETIYNLKGKETYLFYAEIFEGQKGKFNLSLNYMNYTPFSNIYIDEYDSRDLISTKSTNISIPILLKDNQLISTFNYSASSNEIKYISIRIIPSYDINYMKIKFEFPINIFNLSNSIPYTIDYLISGSIYLFFVKATQYAKANISINFNFTSGQEPLNSIYLYEYEKKNNSYSSYLKKEIKNITDSIKENEYQVKISYFIESNLTNFLAFSINPLYNISYFTSKCEIFGGSFLLESGGAINNIGYLKSNSNYYLFIRATQFNKVNIELAMNYMNDTPFSNITFSELNNEKNYIYSYESHSKSMITENNQSIISLDYLLNQSKSSYYLEVKITPLYDIDSVIARINIINCYYDLFYNKETVKNLKAGNQYYFKIDMTSYSQIRLDLTVNNMDYYPFSHITIYETSEDFPSNYMEIETYQNLNFTKVNNELQVSIIYNSYYKYRYRSELDIYVVIEPIYDINYMICNKYHSKEFDDDDDYDDESDSNIATIIMFIIILSIIIITVITLIIVKKCKNNEIEQIQSLSPFIGNNTPQDNSLSHLNYPSQYIQPYQNNQ